MTPPDRPAPNAWRTRCPATKDWCENEACRNDGRCRSPAQPAPDLDAPRSWRCFHCDEVFTDSKAAAVHFGADESAEPGCKMLTGGDVELLRDYRDMAARWQRCVSEDCDASRIYNSMSAERVTAVRDAEQAGYDKGLAGGRNEAAAAITSLRAQLAERDKRVSELENEQAEFDVWYAARNQVNELARKKWQEATGRENVWPDATDLLLFLANENEAQAVRLAYLLPHAETMKARVSALKAALKGALAELESEGLSMGADFEAWTNALKGGADT